MKKVRRMDYFGLQARLRNLKAIELQAIRHGDKEKAEMVSTLSTITVLCFIWAIFASDRMVRLKLTRPMSRYSKVIWEDL